jgi:hypothetical protein
MTPPLQFTCGPAILGGDGTLSLTLTVSADSAALPVSRGTGVPVSEDNVGSGGPTTLYLSFGSLVDAATVPGIGLATIDGWQAQYFASPEPSIAIYRDGDGQLAPGTSVAFSLTRVKPTAPMRVAKLGIDAYGVGTPDASSSFTPPVPVQASTPGAALPDKVHLTVDPSNIVFVQQPNFQPVTNQLTFQLAYPNPEPGATTLVPPNTPLPADMKITLSFVYSDPPGYDALTNAAFSVNEGETYTDAWQASVDSSGNLLWELTPLTPGVLSPGGMVEFVITKLTTPLEAGETQMYVQYKNIPGYSDGFLSAPQIKEIPQPKILSFLPLVPTTAPPDSAVALTWSTSGVERADLSWKDHDGVHSVSTDDGAIGFVEPSYTPTQEITEHITYALTVWSGGVQRDYRGISFTVAGAAPKVGEIVATTGVVTAGQSFLLMAEIDNADTVTITIDGDGVTGSISLPVDADGIMRAGLVSADGASFTAAGGTGSIDTGPTPGLSPVIRLAASSQGSTAQNTYQMTLLPPHISRFDAWLGELDGNDQIMGWTTSNAVKLIISPADGLGNSSDNGAIGPDVTNIADCAATGDGGTTYTLTATGFGSVTSDEVFHNANTARIGARLRGLRVAPDGLGVGGTAQLTATTAPARKYTLSIDGGEGSAEIAADADGSLHAQLTAPDAATIVLAGTAIALKDASATSVTLRVASAGESASTVLLNLLPASVDSFDARPQEGGGLALSWQTSHAASAWVTPDFGAGSSGLRADGVAAPAGTYVLRAQGFGPPAGRLLSTAPIAIASPAPIARAFGSPAGT